MTQYDTILTGAVPRACGEVRPMVSYIELFTYTLVLLALVTLVVKIKK